MQIDRQRAHLVKGDPEIDVDDLARPIVHENVGDVSIPQTQHVTHDRRRRDAPRVVESHREPGDGRLVLLGEKVPHDGSRLLADVFELLDHRVHPSLVTIPR